MVQVKHNNNTGRYITNFRAVWVPQASAVLIGSPPPPPTPLSSFFIAAQSVLRGVSACTTCAGGRRKADNLHGASAHAASTLASVTLASSHVLHTPCTGNMNKKVDILDRKGKELASLAHEQCSAIPAVNVAHPSRALVASGNGSGYVNVWAPA